MICHATIFYLASFKQVKANNNTGPSAVALLNNNRIINANTICVITAGWKWNKKISVSGGNAGAGSKRNSRHRRITPFSRFDVRVFPCTRTVCADTARTSRLRNGAYNCRHDMNNGLTLVFGSRCATSISCVYVAVNSASSRTGFRKSPPTIRIRDTTVEAIGC